MDPGSARFLAAAEGGRLLEAARNARAVPAHQRPGALGGLGTPEQIRAALQQDDLRRRAASRCPHADALLFTREALEQATAWAVAEERAGRWPAPVETPLADLGAGIGFDALATALTGRPVQAYERDPVRALLLEHNARALGLETLVQVRGGDLCDWMPAGALAFLDPGRRAGTRRTRDPGAFEPPEERWSEILVRFETAMLKLPPQPTPETLSPWPQEVVSLAGRVRERRCFVGAWDDLAPLRALALPSGRHVEGEGAPWPDAVDVEDGVWLLDPDASVTVAGLVGDLARRDGLAPVHPRIAYLVGTEPNETAPGHWMQVESRMAAKERVLNRWLRAHRIGNLTIRKRGVERKVTDWRRRLRPRGPHAGTLVITRARDDSWVAYGCRESGGGA